jgi:hypothetical protein
LQRRFETTDADVASSTDLAAAFFIGPPVHSFADLRLILRARVPLVVVDRGRNVRGACKKRALRQHHVEQALTATRPLSKVMAERVAALRAWAKDRTVRA